MIDIAKFITEVEYLMNEYELELRIKYGLPNFGDIEEEKENPQSIKQFNRDMVTIYELRELIRNQGSNYSIR